MILKRQVYDWNCSTFCPQPTRPRTRHSELPWSRESKFLCFSLIRSFIHSLFQFLPPVDCILSHFRRCDLRPPQWLFASHVPHVPVKKAHVQELFFRFSIQKKLLISRTDSELNFIRVLFFFSDLITTLRNRRHKVFYLLGFANLRFLAWNQSFSKGWFRWWKL